MPRSKAKVKDEDIDDILEDLDEMDEEDLEDEEDPDEAPAKKRRARKGSAKKVSTREEIQFGSAWLADLAGIESRELRVLLRKEFPKGDDSRYSWTGPNDPQVKQILRRIKEGASKEAQTEKLQNLKSSKNSKKSTKKSRKAKRSAA